MGAQIPYSADQRSNETQLRRVRTSSACVHVYVFCDPFWMPTECINLLCITPLCRGFILAKRFSAVLPLRISTDLTTFLHELTQHIEFRQGQHDRYQ